ncbi:MAG: hypothetical protein DRO52_02105 [Candidatus Hecatellales archaeon]|nr:MAG: hypothetical protein DRO52_02105 [Candidatus Hecatellales archaeon]
MKRVEEIPKEGPLYVHLGCLSRAMYPGIEYSSLKTLEMLGFKPFSSYEEVCCTGLLYLSGFTSLESLAAFAGWNTSLASAHSKHIASACDTCYSAYLEALRAVREDSQLRVKVEKLLGARGVKPVRDVQVHHIAEIYSRDKDRIIERQQRSLEGLKVAVHHGCHYAKSFPEKVLGKPENVRFLKELVGLLGGEAVEYAEENLCCGSCLSVSGYCDRETSLRVTEAKLSSMREAGAELILVTCPGCLTTFNEAPEELKPLPVLHVSELVGYVLGLDPIGELALEDRKVRLPLLVKG